MKKFTMLLVVFMMLAIVGCTNNQADDVFKEGNENGGSESTGVFEPGSYEGVGQGHAGELKVLVTVNENNIEKVELVESNESEFTVDPINALINNIIEENSADIDAISGASASSNGVLVAVREALSQAYLPGMEPTYEAKIEEANSEAMEDVTTDILVIGGGGAGLSAAISASQNGAEVVLVEKLAFLGGNTNFATGGMNASETDEQTEQGIEDSQELFYEDTMKGGKDLNNPELVEVLTSQSDEAIDWLDSIGISLSEVSRFGGASVDRIHRPEGGAAVGSYMMGILPDKAKELGVDIRLETKAVKVLEEDGKVIGAIVENNGQTYTINSKAVIVATGGFGYNNELVASFNPELEGYGTTNGPGATGDVFEILDDTNAAYLDLEQIQIHPTVVPEINKMITEGVRGDGAILVNFNGERFVNELLTRDVVSQAILQQDKGDAILVFDQQVRDSLSAIESYYKAGLLTEANSIEELATALEVPAESLKNTVDTYNQYAQNGVDEGFGREDMKVEISQEPFYAVVIHPAVHHTMGGVKINANAQVINEDESVTAGLFAAGEVTGGVHGANRLGGNAVADIVVFGKLSGEKAAEFVKN